MRTLDVADPATWAGHILAARRLRAVMIAALIYLFAVDLLWGVPVTHVPVYILNGYVIGDSTSRIRNYRVLQSSTQEAEKGEGERVDEVGKEVDGNPAPPPTPQPNH